MRESKVERYLKRTVTRLGGECLKWVSPGRNGVNDQLAFMPGGKLFLFECKRPGKDLEPHQKRFKEKMAKLGFEVHKCDSIEFVDEFFKGY